MKYSIVMTVYNRPQIALINTLNAIGKNDIQDSEILIVDDCSTLPYDDLWNAYDERLRVVKVDTCKDRPGTYNIDGFNNPAYASNVGIKEAKGDNIIWVVSDVVMQPHTLQKIRALDLENVIYMPQVFNQDDSQEYLGPHRMTPFGWVMATSRKNFEAVPWDEEYLKGIAFEDNDFTARLALEVGRIIVDLGCTAWHQSHESVAYSDELKGHKINEAYTVKKWGGVPWYKSQNCPLNYRLTEINDQLIVDMGELKENVA